MFFRTGINNNYFIKVKYVLNGDEKEEVKFVDLSSLRRRENINMNILDRSEELLNQLIWMTMMTIQTTKKNQIMDTNLPTKKNQIMATNLTTTMIPTMVTNLTTMKIQKVLYLNVQGLLHLYHLKTKMLKKKQI